MKELTILERIMLASLLNSEPIMNNMVGLKEKRELLEALSFTEQEVSDYSIVNHPDGRATWNPSYSKEVKSINIPQWLIDVAIERLKKLDSESKLTDQLFGLCEKFIVD